MSKFVILGLFYTVAVICNALENDDVDKCKHCDLANCPQVGLCPAGIVRDECGCCEVCGLEEGYQCNNSQTKAGLIWQGYCGTGMECKTRKDIDKSKVKEQSICVCETKGAICGTDGKTYSYCEFWAAQQRSLEKGRKLKIQHRHPCISDVKLISISESKAVAENSEYSVSCEIASYPQAKIEWYFLPYNSAEKMRLPGFDEEVSVTERSGAKETMLIGYLQFGRFLKRHEGSYTCVALGSQSEVSGTLALTLAAVGAEATNADL